MSDFELSENADRDIEEILDYIARDDLDAAAAYDQKLQTCFVKLAQNPGLGHQREDLTTADLRFWPIDSYLII